MFLLKRDYFNKTYIIKGLCTALLFSSALYLAFFQIESEIINTIFGLFSLYLLLTIDRKSLFYAGFFIGLFWFYWVSLSFQYYNLSYLIPLIILLFALGYGILFLLTAIKDTLYFRALLLFGLSFVEPFGFNWLKFELLFLDSFFEVSKIEFFGLILATVFLVKRWMFLYIVTLLALFLTTSIEKKEIQKSHLKIALPEYYFEQNYKWNRKNQQSIISENMRQIDQAILQHNDVVVLPETTFPLVLNQRTLLMDTLIKKSKQITIVTGGMFYENEQFKNSTYIFNNGNFEVAHKVVLVPFGEAIPLPEKITNFINDVFYDGAKDYTKAKKPSDYKIIDIPFRNAICYEATSEEIYENLNGVQYVIAISNNAWFTPSIEPTLQRQLLKYFAKRYQVIIYHQANGSKNEVIQP